MQCIIFEVSNRKYCINIANVSGIHEITEFTQIPNSSEFIEGLINLRGKVIPVVNLAVKFGYLRSEITEHSRIINVNLGNELLGILVDSVQHVSHIEDSDIEEPPTIIMGKNREYISKIAKLDDNIAIIIDTDKLLTNEEWELLLNIGE